MHAHATRHTFDVADTQEKLACAANAGRLVCWFNNPGLVAKLRAPVHPEAPVPVVVDLHGMRVREVRALLAELCVGQTWRGRGRRNRGPKTAHVRIVTGRGLHSGGASPKLVGVVGNFVAKAAGVVTVTTRSSGSVTVTIRGR